MHNDKNMTTFRGQREDEELIQLIHRHPWALAKPGLFVSLGLVLLILIFVYFQFSGPSIWSLFILGPILLIYGGYEWFLWWNSLYLITNQRVITITQSSLWSRQIEDYSLEKIQSVASNTQGMSGTMLNFGIVMLAIMGIKDRVELPFVEDPFEVQEKILTATRALSGERVETALRAKRRLIKH